MNVSPVATKTVSRESSVGTRTIVVNGNALSTGRQTHITRSYCGNDRLLRAVDRWNFHPDVRVIRLAMEILAANGNKSWIAVTEPFEQFETFSTGRELAIIFVIPNLNTLNDVGDDLKSSGMEFGRVRQDEERALGPELLDQIDHIRVNVDAFDTKN